MIWWIPYAFWRRNCSPCCFICKLFHMEFVPINLPHGIWELFRHNRLVFLQKLGVKTTENIVSIAYMPNIEFCFNIFQPKFNDVSSNFANMVKHLLSPYKPVTIQISSWNQKQIRRNIYSWKRVFICEQQIPLTTIYVQFLSCFRLVKCQPVTKIFRGHVQNTAK